MCVVQIYDAVVNWDAHGVSTILSESYAVIGQIFRILLIFFCETTTIIWRIGANDFLVIVTYVLLDMQTWLLVDYLCDIPTAV